MTATGPAAWPPAAGDPVKVGKYNVPTPLLIGGVAGVGILVLGQRLTGQAGPSEPIPDPAAGTPPTSGGGAAGDLWGDEVGQFPSFPAAGGTPPSAGAGYEWWDDEAPPAAAPINVVVPTVPVTQTPVSPAPAPTPVPVAPAPTTATVARPSGAKPSSGVAGYARVSGVPMYKMWGSWSTYPNPVSGLRDTGMSGSRWVSTPRMVYFGSDPAKRQFAVRRVAGTDGVWGVWFAPASIVVYPG